MRTQGAWERERGAPGGRLRYRVRARAAPGSPVELVAELVALSTIAVGLTSIAHLAAVALRDRRAAGV